MSTGYKVNRYTHRNLARVIIESVTPLAVGNGEKDIITDALVARDVNGLPYIPGTALAGVLRHALGVDIADPLFGYQGSSHSDSHGSEIIFSDARMVGEKDEVIDGLQPLPDTPFYERYMNLPIRQHARIAHRGVTADTGKFDEQVVYKGTRFCFTMEVVDDGSNSGRLRQVLDMLTSPEFRVGGGTRKGFGSLKVIECQTLSLDLARRNPSGIPVDLETYVALSPDLSKPLPGAETYSPRYESSGWNVYEVKLSPEDFLLCGSGFGDADADMTPVKEHIVAWDGPVRPIFRERQILIPGTSLKGALSHRTAYHWNRLNSRFIDSSPAPLEGSDNPAVMALFGSEGRGDGEAQRGNVIVNDIIESSEGTCDMVQMHVSIDRLTNAPIDGALFNEKVTYAKGRSFSTRIMVKKLKTEDETIIKSFEAALTDLVNGLLPLGGGVNRGHGCFTGKWTKIDKA